MVFQGNGSVCTEDRTGSSDIYPSYTMFTTSQRPWLRPLLTTPTTPVARSQYPGSVSVAKGKPMYVLLSLVVLFVIFLINV